MPALLVDEILALAQINAGDFPALVRNQMNPAGRKQHPLQPRGAADPALGDNRIRSSPQNRRPVKRYADRVRGQERICQSLKKIAALDHAEVRRRGIHSGRITLCSRSAEQIRCQQQPHGRVWIQRCAFRRVDKVRVVVAARTRAVQNTCRLDLLLNRRIDRALQKRSRFIKQVERYAFFLAGRDVLLDFRFRKLSLLQQVFKIRFAFRAQRVHQKKSEKTIDAVFLQRRRT